MSADLRAEAPKGVERRAAGVRRRAAAAAMATCSALGLGWVGCNGTNGREDLTPALGDAGAVSDATVDGADAGEAQDAATSYDTGAFDVDILFADRMLPDVAVPPEGGSAGETGTGLPDCPPWIPIDDNGNPVPVDDPSQVDFVPADWGANGSVVPAADGGACAAYPWYAFIEPKFRQQWATDTAGDLQTMYGPFPPCNWARDAGVAQAGTESMHARYDLCMALYACIAQSGCWQDVNGIAGCLCGLGDAGSQCLASGTNPVGPCAAAEIAAFEMPADQTVKAYIIANYIRHNVGSTPAPPYINASALNFIYSYARSQKTYPEGGTHP